MQCSDCGSLGGNTINPSVSALPVAILVCINPGRPGLVPKGKRIGGDEGQHSARIKIIQYPVGLIF